MPNPHVLLRVYTDEAAISGDRSVVEIVLERAHGAGLLGATVHRAQAGFGHAAHLHRQSFIDRNNPVVIEIVDVEPRVRAFWEDVSTLSGIGLVTLEKVEVIRGGREED